MKLWPSRNSSVVEALRLISPGTEVPATVTVWAVSIWLTSGLIIRLIRPSLQHGRREREADAVGLVGERHRAGRAGFGIGNLAAGQEARGIAGQSATRLGSARLRARPFCSSALTATCTRLPTVGRAETRTAPRPTARRRRRWPPSRKGRQLRCAGKRRRPGYWRRDLIADIGERRVAETCSTARRARGWPARSTSMKRTSSITCCCCSTFTVLMSRIGRELARDHHRLVEGGGVRRGAGQHDAAVDRGHLDAAVAELRDLRSQP